MKLVVTRHNLSIEPQGDIDEAYIEEVLKLRKDGDSCLLTRKNAMGLGCMAHLKTEVLSRPGVKVIAQAVSDEYRKEDESRSVNDLLVSLNNCLIDGAYHRAIALLTCILEVKGDKEA